MQVAGCRLRASGVRRQALGRRTERRADFDYDYDCDSELGARRAMDTRERELEAQGAALLRAARPEGGYRKLEYGFFLEERHLERRRRTERPLDPDEIPAITGTEALAIARIEAQNLRQMVDRLYRRAGVPEVERVALLLKLYDFSDGEIAWVMGVTERTVRNRRRAGMLRLDNRSRDTEDREQRP